jgi:hypothetical protein
MHRTSRILVVLSALMLTLFLAGGAFAQSFEITWSTPTSEYGSGSGNFAATYDGGGVYTLTHIISGSQNGDPITSLLPPNGYGGNDNLIFPASPGLVDIPGFSIAAGGIDYNIYFYGGKYYECSPLDNSSNCYVGSGYPLSGGGAGDLTITATPEPSTILLFLSGFGALLILAGRKVTA